MRQLLTAARLRTAGVEVGLLSAAALDALVDTSAWGSAWTWCVTGLALVGVALRHRSPRSAFVLTLPGLVTSFALVATLVTLFELARRSTSRRVVVLAGVVAAVGFVLKTPAQLGVVGARETLLDVVYGLLTGAAPVALGLLVRARSTLGRQIAELERAHRTERELRDAQVLDRERSRLAREMHDVVSHQVSLIAVQAGALQVAATDEGSRQAARTVRGLAVSTLEELRHMVEVLRASSPGASSLQPQPGLADLPALVEGSGLDVDLDVAPDVAGGLPLDQHAQRAVYRTVQEGLTNVRKHAPGAQVRVVVARDGEDVTTEVVSGPPTGRPLALPGSGLGLIGLRERAELAGGVLQARSLTDGGFRLAVRLPVGRRH